MLLSKEEEKRTRTKLSGQLELGFWVEKDQILIFLSLQNFILTLTTNSSYSYLTLYPYPTPSQHTPDTDTTRHQRASIACNRKTPVCALFALLEILRWREQYSQ
jgi:hypothetical protein